MKLSLISMRLKNFKGIKDFTFNPNSKNLTLAGDNGTGKTTVFDGFNWLFFGKDSQGKADFQIKPVDKENIEKSKINSEVEGLFDIDGNSLSLLRRYKEKYTKKRGEAKKTFTGHTTEYFIDEVPANEKDFKSKIAEIIDIDKFKMITNTFEFNNISWEKRRNILFEMCGDVDNQDVIDSNKKLESLSEILKSSTVGDHKKKIAARRREINKQIEEIPIRIEELVSTNEAPEMDKKEYALVESQIVEYRDKLQSIKSNERISAKRVRINEINAEISKAVGDAQDELYKKKKPINDEIDKLDKEKRGINNSIKDCEDAIIRDGKRNKITEDSLATLRDQWRLITRSQQNIETDCPTCGQHLPEDKIKSAQDKLNQDQAKKLEENQKEGKACKAAYDERKKDIAFTEERIVELSGNLSELNKKIVAKKEELKNVISSPIDNDALENEKEIIKSEIEALENGSKVQQNECNIKLDELGQKLTALQQIDADFKAAENSRVRIEELKAQEKKLCEAFENIEKELHIVEQFIKSKVGMVEGKINSRFGLAKFKLFRKQINGGIEPCCDTLYDGVPYNHGLNNAARINVGLDIINTISEYYGFKVPVFIDNSESVNELIDIDSQLISLEVSKNKELIILR